MMMRRKRGTQAYTEDFRREAVRLVEAGTKSPAEIARELYIHPETLRLWRRRLGTTGARDGAPAAPRGRGSVVPALEEENRRLRRENARLLEEREILKKATAFFAKGAR